MSNDNLRPAAFLRAFVPFFAVVVTIVVIFGALVMNRCWHDVLTDDVPAEAEKP